MITYIAKSSSASVTDSAPMLIVAANRDRKHLEFNWNGAVYIGDSSVSTTNGYAIVPPIRLDGEAATAAVYGISIPGSTVAVSVLEIVPDL